MAEQPPVMVVTEACGSAHHWVREKIKLGHEVKFIAPHYVKPFVKICSGEHIFTNRKVARM